MGALLQIKVLEGTSGAWLLDMLEAFNDGDLHRYDELCTKHADTLNQLPQMVEHEPKLREKITILALTELIFRHLPRLLLLLPILQICHDLDCAVSNSMIQTLSQFVLSVCRKKIRAPHSISLWFLSRAPWRRGREYLVREQSLTSDSRYSTDFEYGRPFLF